MWRNIAKSGHTATYPLFIRLKSYRIPPLLFSRWIQSFTELNIQPVNNHILSLGEVSLYGWHPALFVGIQPVCLCWMDNSFTCLVKSNQSNRRSAVQQYFSLQSKWVFCDSAHVALKVHFLHLIYLLQFNALVG